MITPTASLRTAAISLLFGAFSVFAASPTLASSTCTSEAFEGARYTVCNPGSAEALRLFWDNQDGAPYRSFSAVADAVAADGKQLRFAMNAGMYDTNFKPLGLYAADGKEKVRISTAQANPTKRPVPNFLKKPNGVFYVDRDGKAGVLTTEDYLAAGIEARIATQSGPMLVINGALHPALLPGRPTEPDAAVLVCARTAMCASRSARTGSILTNSPACSAISSAATTRYSSMAGAAWGSIRLTSGAMTFRGMAALARCSASLTSDAAG
jgi:uncharacterized protein YigE (DUF2233 family)